MRSETPKVIHEILDVEADILNARERTATATPGEAPSLSLADLKSHGEFEPLLVEGGDGELVRAAGAL